MRGPAARSRGYGYPGPVARAATVPIARAALNVEGGASEAAGAGGRDVTIAVAPGAGPLPRRVDGRPEIAARA